jgi:hypothetical protein
MPGPMPKRSEERTRRNKQNEAGLELKKGNAHGYKRWPKPDPDWHPRVKEWFTSLGNSGMEAFYEESDITTAKIIADGLDQWYKKPSALMFDMVLKHMAPLGVTEGERRRMRIELEVPQIEEESVGAQAQKRWEERLRRPATVTQLHPEPEEEAPE